MGGQRQRVRLHDPRNPGEAPCSHSPVLTCDRDCGEGALISHQQPQQLWGKGGSGDSLGYPPTFTVETPNIRVL